MYYIFWLLLIELFFVSDVTFGQYCSSTQDTFQAYSLGRNVFVGQGAAAVWHFNSDVNQVLDKKLSLKEIYGENAFEWVDTAFGFNFNECGSDDSESYCNAINKARNTVIAIGQKKQETGSRKYGFLAYIMDSNGILNKVNDTKIAWDLSSSGTLTGNFWVSLPGDLYYESSVFVVSRNELYVSVYDTSSSTDSKYHLMSRKLEDNGKWADNWVEVSKLGFRGMFDINGRVFGMNKKNIIYEFIWSENSVAFNKISHIKELLNCFDNSTLKVMQTISTKVSENVTDVTTTLEPIQTVSSQLNTNITTTDVLTTLEELQTIIPEVIENSTVVVTSTSPDVITETVPIETVPTETAPTETVPTETVPTETVPTETVPTIQEIITTQNPMITESPIAEQTSLEGKPFIWTFILVIGLILLLTIVILMLLIIYRRKTKSQIIYLNPTPNQSKKSKSLHSSSPVESLHSKIV